MATTLLSRTLALLLLALLPWTPARAASLSQVASFGTNPGNLTMYAYRPDGLASGRPLVVLLHGCTQNAAGYFASSGWRKYADQWGFALVLAQTGSANNSASCFNWFQTGDTTRGQGEAASIRNMVAHAVAAFGSDPARVHVSGLSAGGAMAAVMLATYPDVFAAGSIGAGLAYRCATSLTQASSCQYGPTSRTPRQWGDLVRGAHPATRARTRGWRSGRASPTTPSFPRTATSCATSGPTCAACPRPRRPPAPSPAAPP